jgi:hypothetical protein
MKITQYILGTPKSVTSAAWEYPGLSYTSKRGAVKGLEHLMKIAPGTWAKDSVYKVTITIEQVEP